MSQHTAEATLMVAAPPERVFDAWIDGSTMSKFMCPIPGGSAKATSSGAVGGALSVEMIAPDGTSIAHTGTYSTVDRPRTLAFSWNSPYTHDSIVTLTFVLQGEGTEVRLVHTGLADAAQADNHSGGWMAMLQQLDALLR